MAVRRVDLATFLESFDPSVHERIGALLDRDGVSAVVCFENVCMDSSALGERTALIVGPSCTYKNVDACEGQWLNDLPSQRQYPQFAVEK